MEYRGRKDITALNKMKRGNKERSLYTPNHPWGNMRKKVMKVQIGIKEIE